MHALSHLVPVDDQRAERSEHQERQETVEQRGACHHKADPIGDQQHSGDRADQRRTADATHDPDDQRHHQHAEDRAGETPPQPVVAEDGLADRDQLLADRRMDD